MTRARGIGCVVIAVVTAALGPAMGPARAQAPDMTIDVTAPTTSDPIVTAAPTVTIVTPAPGSAPTTSSPAVDLSGIVDDTVGVVEVTWSTDRGSYGTADGTASWSVAGVPLEPGPNEVTVTARDRTGAIASSSIVVTYETPVVSRRTGAPAPAVTYTMTVPSTAGSTTTTTAPRAASSAPAAPSLVSAVATGPVAAYSFEEGGGTTVADRSGNNNTGVLSGGVSWTTQGKFGKALVFHGSGFVTVPGRPSLDLTSAMTLEAWVYPTASPTQASTAVMKEQPGELAYALYAGSATGRPGTQLNVSTDAAGRRGAGGPAIVPLNAWTHLAATFDGSTLQLYVNGTLVASRAAAGPITTSGSPLRIGGNAIWGEFFRGRIDNVRIYDRALSQVEIRSDMVTPVGPQSPSTAGQWAGPFSAPIVTIHATLLRTGQVLVWEALGGGGSVHVWNPSTSTFTKAEPSQTNIFCAGHCALPDGRIFVVGGHVDAHVGLPDTNIFDPANGVWEGRRQMNRARWYPTATTLPDGRLLVTAGEDGCFGCYVETPEIYEPQTDTWTPLSSATASLPFYPHMFVLSNGRVLAASATEDTIVSQVLDVDTQTWSVVDPVAVPGGSAVMYRPDKIMKAGTNFDSDVPVVPSGATTYVLDMTRPSPAWEQTASMAFPRSYHNLTLLPDGQVLATGGGDTTDAVGVDGAIGAAELWSPVTRQWTTLAAMQKPRLYHSIALLLPDARVLVGGGGRFSGPPSETDQLTIEIFSPPYLFKGARPVITTAPATASYGATMAVATPDAARIASVALVKPGSVTHSFNADQRYVPLSFGVSGAGLTVQAPASANLAPPGYYMLFIVDTNGVPSVAKFVRLQ